MEKLRSRALWNLAGMGLLVCSILSLRASVSAQEIEEELINGDPVICAYAESNIPGGMMLQAGEINSISVLQNWRVLNGRECSLDTIFQLWGDDNGSTEILSIVLGGVTQEFPKVTCEKVLNEGIKGYNCTTEKPITEQQGFKNMTIGVFKQENGTGSMEFSDVYSGNQQTAQMRFIEMPNKSFIPVSLNGNPKSTFEGSGVLEQEVVIFSSE